MVNMRLSRRVVSGAGLAGTALVVSGSLAFQAGIPQIGAAAGDPPPGSATSSVPNLATADDATLLGTIASGSYVATHDSDGTPEALREVLSGGKPKTRKSLLDHVWRFDVAGGASYQLAVEAWHTPNLEHDDFVFSFSRDDVNFTPLITVASVADDDTVQLASIPVDASGTVYIRVEDTDETPGWKVLDTVFVDSLAVLTDDQGPDATPPSAAYGLAAMPGDSLVTLSWNDWGEWDLEGARVYRGPAADGPWSQITSAPEPGNTFVDDTAVNLNVYYYMVRAADTTGNLSPASNVVMAVPRPDGVTSVFMHVSKLAVMQQTVVAGWRQGRADVTVVDENGAPVAGALVVGDFTGALNQTKSATTDAKGLATVLSTQALKGTFSFSFCVTNVTQPTKIYVSDQNLANCGSK